MTDMLLKISQVEKEAVQIVQDAQRKAEDIIAQASKRIAEKTSLELSNAKQQQAELYDRAMLDAQKKAQEILDDYNEQAKALGLTAQGNINKAVELILKKAVDFD